MAPDHPDFDVSSPADRIAAEAAVWLSRQDHGMTSAQRRAFEAWLAGPREAAEFNRIARVWDQLDRVRAHPGLSDLARKLDESTRARRGPRSFRYGVATLAAAAVVLFGFLVRPRPARVQASAVAATTLSYEVVPSSARVLTLADGSRVDLRDNSEVSTDFTPATRRLRLLRGEAHFQVTKNPQRPFIVSVGAVSVRAVGTAFDIQTGQDQIDVVVTEGKVRVEDLGGGAAPPLVPQLTAGQRAHIFMAEGGGRPRVTVDALAPTQLEQILAWRSTWLLFDRTRLDAAVDAFNRHSSQRIILGDAALGERRLGGRFRADNVDGFVRLLEEGVDVRSERRSDHEIVLLPARP